MEDAVALAVALGAAKFSRLFPTVHLAAGSEPWAPALGDVAALLSMLNDS